MGGDAGSCGLGVRMSSLPKCRLMRCSVQPSLRLSRLTVMWLCGIGGFMAVSRGLSLCHAVDLSCGEYVTRIMAGRLGGVDRAGWGGER